MNFFLISLSLLHWVSKSKTGIGDIPIDHHECICRAFERTKNETRGYTIVVEEVIMLNNVFYSKNNQSIGGHTHVYLWYDII